MVSPVVNRWTAFDRLQIQGATKSSRTDRSVAITCNARGCSHRPREKPGHGITRGLGELQVLWIGILSPKRPLRYCHRFRSFPRFTPSLVPAISPDKWDPKWTSVSNGTCINFRRLKCASKLISGCGSKPWRNDFSECWQDFHPKQSCIFHSGWPFL